MERTDTQERLQLTCGFLFMCTGYYRYDEGYTPHFEGTERFRGQIVHPQHWPEELDYAGKRVAVIGSGATAVTLVPAMADEAAHVTMVQRSPSYVVSLPGTDPLADLLRRVLPRKAAYPIVRWKNVLLPTAFFLACRRWPKAMKGLIRRGVVKRLPEGYDVDTHFAPRYQPWDQRLCLVPDGDLFETISAGRASVVTDRIETFTENGLQLESGTELEADVIVTATGLNMLMLGGMKIAVDGRDVDALRDRRLQGHDAQRRAEHGGGARLHERVVDAQVRPRDPVRVPSPEPHGRQRATGRPRRARRTSRWPPSPSSTWPPATSCARSTPCPSRAAAPPGGSTRTTSAT